MGLFSLNGTFLEIFIPFNGVVGAGLAIIKLFIDKFELSMLPFEVAAADVPFVTMTAYVPLVMVTNLITVFYVLLGEGKAYDNSDSRSQKAKFKGLKARVSAAARVLHVVPKLERKPLQMVAAHNNTLEGVGILLSGLFVATSKGLDADLLAELCVLIYLCRIGFIFACEPSLPCLHSCPEDRSGSLADRRAF